MLKVMGICVQHHTNVSKQTTLFDCVDTSAPKWCMCGCGLNQSVHEGMKDISNVMVQRLSAKMKIYKS